MTSDAEVNGGMKARGSCFFRNTKDVTMVPTWGQGFYARVMPMAFCD